MNNLKSKINSQQLTPGQIIAIVIAIIFAGLLTILVINILTMSKRIGQLDSDKYQNKTELKAYLTATYTPKIAAIIEGENSPWLGSPNPQVTIVEFADFACEFCKEAYPTIRQIGAKYQNKVKIIFRDRPGFADSVALALAAHCANEQDKFWAFHDKLYQNYTPGITDNADSLINLARQVGLDITALTTCINEQRYLDKIETGFIDAQSLGVTGTPTWFVNGQKFEGVLSLAEWEEIINSLID